MDAIDELIAQQKRDFEEFKRKQQEQLESRRKTRENTDPDQYSEPIGPKQRKRNKGKTQYSDPIGPDPIIPKDRQLPPGREDTIISRDRQLPPGQDELEEEWESEVPDQLGTKLDELLEQVRNEPEPLPQPGKTKRRKTRGKKKLDRKMLSTDGMGLSSTIKEIHDNVVDTRIALFNLYKLEKKRFEFKKKIDKTLTQRLAARKRERELEAEDSLDPTKDSSAEAKSNFLLDLLGPLLGPLKKAGIGGLVGALGAFLLPQLIDVLEPFFTKPLKGENNQWWDPLGIIPDPDPNNRTPENWNAFDQLGETLNPSSQFSAEPTVRTGERAGPQSFGDYFRWQGHVDSRDETGKRYVDGDKNPMGDVTKPGARGEAVPVPGSKPVDINDQMSGKVPPRKAAKGGHFTDGKHKKLTPVSNFLSKDDRISKLNKPLQSGILLPQKISALTLVNFANSILQPLSGLMPKEAMKEIDQLFSGVLKSTGLSSFQLNKSQDNLFDKLKKLGNDILNGLIGGTANAAPNTTGYTPSGTSGNTVGGNVGPAPEGGYTGDAKKALDIIGKYESDSVGGYNAVNQIGTAGGRGTEGFAGDIRNMKQHGGKSLTDMTIADIMALQADDGTLSNEQWKEQGKLHAVGRYQFIGSTLKNLVNSMGIDKSQKFSTQIQDQLALQLLKQSGYTQWVGPTDKASASEKAMLEKVRRMSPEQLKAMQKKTATPQEIARSTQLESSKHQGPTIPMVKPPPAKTPPAQNPKREINWQERFLSAIGMRGKPKPNQSQPPKSPKRTDSVSSGPKLQPGGF